MAASVLKGVVCDPSRECVREEPPERDPGWEPLFAATSGVRRDSPSDSDERGMPIPRAIAALAFAKGEGLTATGPRGEGERVDGRLVGAELDCGNSKGPADWPSGRVLGPPEELACAFSNLAIEASSFCFSW